MARHLPLQKQLLVGEWQIILLNSQVHKKVHGNLTESELALLEQALHQYPAKPTRFMHHQPVPIGAAWIDQHQIRSADAFFAIVDQHPQVKGIGWGHVHQVFESERNGVKLFSTPSTAFNLPRSKWISISIPRCQVSMD